MANFPIDTAQIVALFMESVFYGIYLVTYVACMRVLLWSNGQMKQFSAINKTMLVASLSMLAFGTLDVGFGLRHNIEAFIYSQGEPEAHFEDIGSWINVMKMVDYVAQTFIGDAILLYRCFVVYDKNWPVIIPPTLIWIATTICGIMVCYFEATVGSGPLSQTRLKPFITSMLSLTLATNVLTTGLIVYRIWTVESKISRFRSSSASRSNSPLSKVMRILIESGLIYTSAILILFGTYLANSNAILGISDSVVQIIGITFNLIILSTDRARQSVGTIDHVSSHAPVSLNGSLPLHMLNIHTDVSISRHPPEFDSQSSSVKHDQTIEKDSWAS